jgi:hypothetical protein|tara:strand:- start:592 stop:840 length:249 start_codon:yes stop_codon:yes gene_type:complete
MQDIHMIALSNQTAKIVDRSHRRLTDRQFHQLSVLMFSVANQWLNAYKLGLCTWTVAKNNAVMLDDLSNEIDGKILELTACE